MHRLSSNGLVYPTISGVLYVEWRYIEEGDPDLVGQRYAGTCNAVTEILLKSGNPYTLLTVCLSAQT